MGFVPADLIIDVARDRNATPLVVGRLEGASGCSRAAEQVPTQFVNTTGLAGRNVAGQHLVEAGVCMIQTDEAAIVQSCVMAHRTRPTRTPS